MNIKSLIRALVVGASLAATSAFANSVNIVDLSNDGNTTGGNGDGGEFLAITSDNGTFVTFCLEEFVKVHFGPTYTYDISSRAFSGGGDAHDPVGAGPAGDPISVGTAWLYTQFIKGTLVGPNGSGSYFTNHDVNAGLLQQAFWNLEDEFAYKNNPYVKLVTDLFGDAGARATYTGSTVRVINLWGPNHTDVQSMLIYVPDSGMTATLLALGLVSLAAFRRKAKA